jgi:cyclic pyranopterin phosphate synthase
MSSNGTGNNSPGHGSSSLVDSCHRSVDYARIAVTSRCNLRCSYCLREEHEDHTDSASTLNKQEIRTIIEVLADLGVKKIRFTGGEPLLRKDIVDLVHQAKKTAGIQTVGLTTNGLLLDRFLPGLVDAGLDALNFSIDTLDRKRYHNITRRDEFSRVKKNLDLLMKTTKLSVKLNVVLMRDVNSDELQRFADLTKDHALTIRFMELQPFDDNQIWRTGRFLGADKIGVLLKSYYPDLKTVQGFSTEFFSYTLPNHRGSIAIIPAFTRNFCSQCNKIRITSNGKIISCLYEKEGQKLLPLLRSNAGNEAIADLFRKAVSQKPEDGKHAVSNSVRTSMSEIGG